MSKIIIIRTTSILISKKDDDKIGLNKKLKRRNKNNNSKKRKMNFRQDRDKLLKNYAGGKKFNIYTNINRNRNEHEHENGLIYNQDWHEKMKKTELEFGLLQLNGFTESFEKETQGIIKEPLNAGWWLITFREGMSKSGTVFMFESHQSIRVSLVDLFCRGDSFSVLDGGNLIAQSSRTLPDRECLERIIDPDEAVREGRWSSVVFNLESGDHEIENKTVDSPMTGGVAAIRFDPVRSMRKVSRKNVCRGYNGLLLITAKLSKFDAEAECNKFKSDLALVSGGEREVLKSLESCLGRVSDELVWVYRKDTRDVESFSLQGFRKTAEDEDNLQFALCRVRTDI